MQLVTLDGMVEQSSSKRIVVGALVVNRRGEILILKRHKNEEVLPGVWELPGGKREAGESTTDALLREVREETGLAVMIIGPVSVFNYRVTKQGEVRDITQINFLARPKASAPQVTMSREHEDIRWVSEHELRQHRMTSEVKAAIKEAFRLALV